MNIYFTSDLHLGHDKEFIWKARGYSSVSEMNQGLIDKINATVGKEDELYILGDILMGDINSSIEYFKNINCEHIHFLIGNHDTPNKTNKLLEAKTKQIDCLGHATTLKINKQRFYLSHYPTITSNLEKSNILGEHIINLFAHTHQVTNFYMEMPFMYHVGVDSHNGFPVSFDEIVNDIKNKIKECEEQL